MDASQYKTEKYFHLMSILLSDLWCVEYTPVFCTPNGYLQYAFGRIPLPLMLSPDKIRNLAIIAHIDHGKTTLIDSIFRSTQLFRKNQKVAERVMDNNDLERERGITIHSKHCTVEWNDYRINIVDTPGHADFSGEVERVLSMVNSVLLLVDANEGPMPQTRYVLMRALRLGLRPIVIINKIDRPNARPEYALDKTFDLFVELGATDEQLDFPVLYGSGLTGWISYESDPEKREGMVALFETIAKEVPPPEAELDGEFLMQVSTLAWDDYIGQIGCGRVTRGTLKKGETFRRTMTKWKNTANRSEGWDVIGSTNERAAHLWETQGLSRADVEEVQAGDIVWIAGPSEISIGDTFSHVETEDPAFPPLEIEQPTVSMLFIVNNGPFAGRDGKAITLRQLKERLTKELRTNVALRMEDVGRSDGVKVSGRGELQLGILIEEMRREGRELCVSRPEVITQEDADGNLLEPIEHVTIDVPEVYQGCVIEQLARRKGDMLHMENTGTGMVRLEFEAPTRGMIGYRNEFLTDTRGLGILASRYIGHQSWRGDVGGRVRGSVVSMEMGVATSYQLESLQARSSLFIEPLDEVYSGMVIGENARPEDLPCNPTKKKAQTNHRASGKDHSEGLDAARKMTLDQAMEWIGDDELVEVTPAGIRLRKATLCADQRKKEDKRRVALLEIRRK